MPLDIKDGLLGRHKFEGASDIRKNPRTTSMGKYDWPRVNVEVTPEPPPPERYAGMNDDTAMYTLFMRLSEHLLQPPGYRGSYRARKIVSSIGDGYLGIRLGSGNFADVFECPWDKEKVIKVGTGDAGNGDIACDGWLQYGLFCLMNPNVNPLMPRVYEILGGQFFYIALLKRYDKIPQMMSEDFIMTRRMRGIQAAISHDPMSQNIDHEAYIQAKHLVEKCGFRMNDIYTDGNLLADMENSSVIVSDPLGSSYENRGETMGELYRSGRLPSITRYWDARNNKYGVSVAVHELHISSNIRLDDRHGVMPAGRF